MIHDNHFEAGKIYNYTPVVNIPIGSEVLAVTEFDNAFSGTLLRVGSRRVIGGDVDIFAIGPDNRPYGYEITFDIGTVQVYRVLSTAALADDIATLTTI